MNPTLKLLDYVFRTIFHPKRDVFHFNMLFQSSLGLNKQINTLIAKESLLRASFSTVSLQQFKQLKSFV